MTAVGFSRGDKLGPYEIIELIGKGGMGEVYRALDTKLSRVVAIKTLSAEFARDIESLSRLQREAQMLAVLNHPNIAIIYGFEESDGLKFLVLELVEGESLAERIDRTGPVPADETLTIAVQVANALEAAHSKGVIHRDIKCANIMITGRGHVKVLDFGLAKQASGDEADETRTLDSLTKVGAFVGTPHYMAPEILQGRPADPRSDVWALGIVLYTMLTGNIPFHRATTPEVCAAILHDPPPPLAASVPIALQRIVERALAKNPSDRFQSASHLRQAFASSNLAATAATTRRRWLWSAGGAVVLAAGGALWTARRPSAPEHLLSTGAPVSAKQEANELFELAMLFQRRQNDLPRSQRTLERALAVDPEFPEALRYHAFGYLIQILNGHTNDTGLLYQAENELKRASQLDPTLISLPSGFTALYMIRVVANSSP